MSELALAQPGNVTTLQCANLPATLQLCQDGGSCPDGFVQNPSDVLNITGVSGGTVLTFEFENFGTFKPTVVKLDGQGGTTFGAEVTFNPPADPVPNPPILTYEVPGGDAPQADFKVQIGPAPMQTFAAVQYTVDVDDCQGPPPPGEDQAFVRIIKTSVGGNGEFGFTTDLPVGTFSLDTDPGGTDDRLFTIQFEDSASDPQVLFVEEDDPPPAGFSFTNLECSFLANPGNASSATIDVRKVDITIGPGASLQCFYTNTKQVGALELEKTPDQATFGAAGQVITYSYTVTNTGDADVTAIVLTDFQVDNLMCDKPPSFTLEKDESVQCTGSYVIQEPDLAACQVTNFAAVQGMSAGGEVFDNAQATITCTGDRTRQLIRSFINRRVDLLASNEPDRARMMRRFNRSVQPAGSNNASPMQLTGKSDASATQFKFATSLSQIAQANRIAEQKKIKSVATMGLGGKTLSAPAYVKTPGIDVWVEGHFQQFDDELGGNDQDGDFGILWVGADYLVSPWFLIGALVQFDWMDQETVSLSNAEVRGRGWMAGPYATLKLSDHLFFDARAAWGESDNDITPFGTYTDSFDTERWLAKANLTGNWNFGHLYVTPSVGVIYVEEDAETYVDSNSNTILGQTVRLGRLTFGPEFRYKSYGTDGSILEPHISFTGMWDFDEDDDADIANVGGLLVSDDDFRVKIEAGLLAHNPNFSAASFRGTVSYDGLGDDDFGAWGGQLWVNWPLN